ncbi:MAG: helix-turn-helix domain-containing protein [Clostridia bacterium]|nr:helix-turn-helix domain-containing protein [Clostridia bacterium]
MKGIHTHFAHEVFFVTSGVLSLVTENGRKCLERSALIIPPGVSHYTVSDTEGSMCMLLSAEDAGLQRLFDEIYVMPLGEETVFYIERFREKCGVGDLVNARLLLTLALNTLLSALLPNRSKRTMREMEMRHIDAIERYINGRLSEKITLGDVADAIHLGERQTSRIILREYGMPLSEMVTEKKLAVAEMLLKNSDMRISEVARQVNFGADNYFYAVFKRKYGISPLQYRKEMKLVLAGQ